MQHFDLECNSSLGFYIFLSKCKFEQTGMSVNRLQELTKKSNQDCSQQELVLRMGIYQNVGYCFGAIIGGILSDLYGRRSTALYFSVAWNILAWIFVFVKQRFLSDICYFGIILCCSVVNVTTFVNFAEIADKKNRILCIYTIPTYIIGGLLTKYVSRTISSWMYQQITVASSVTIMIFACWYMPESPRWLYNKNKKEKAYAQLCEISGLLYTFQLNRNLENPELENNNVLYGMFAFLCRKTKKYFILCNLLMTVSSLSYNSLRFKNILHKIYTKQFDLLTHSAEVLSFLFLLPIYMILGKRVGLCFMYFLFLTVLLVAVFTYDFQQAYIDIFGVIFSMTAINIIWLLILDIFPTFLRGTAIG
ncbi:unnamed protein product, partial [Tenebrio molitor]